jgi:hypothetical protein
MRQAVDSFCELIPIAREPRLAPFLPSSFGNSQSALVMFANQMPLSEGTKR